MKLIKRKSLIDQVIDVIIGKIKSGELKHGERLDSQDEFAAKLGVSRSTVREAFSKLASMGIIEVMHGQGTFVKDMQDYSYMESILSSFNIMEKDAIIQVLEVRKTVERYTVQLAVERAKPEDLDKLEEIYQRLTKLLDNPEKYNRLDKEFHLEVARIGKNPVLLRILSIILSSFHEELSSSIIVPDSLEHSVRTLRKILDSMSRKDVESAVKQMSYHIDEILDRSVENLSHISQARGDQDRLKL